MPRASTVLAAGSWNPDRASAWIASTYDGRHRRRVAMHASGGLEFLLDLPEARALRDGDGLLLDDGRVVRVVASPEPVADVFAQPHLLLRVAWHIGNRHIPCELLPDRIRIARDHVLEAMVQGLGARVERVEAPFQPEAGAYAQGGHGHATGTRHGHHHEHPHEHPHEHHVHGDDHEHTHGNDHHQHQHEQRHGAQRAEHRHGR